MKMNIYALRMALIGLAFLTADEDRKRNRNELLSVGCLIIYGNGDPSIVIDMLSRTYPDDNDVWSFWVGAVKHQKADGNFDGAATLEDIQADAPTPEEIERPKHVLSTADLEAMLVDVDLSGLDS